MFTGKRFKTPNLTGDANQDILALGKAVGDYTQSLELPGALNLRLSDRIDIWRFPGSTVAGEACGLWINISNNNVLSPGANDFVGIFNRVTNDGRTSANLWGMDIIVHTGFSTGDHNYRGIEVEIGSDTALGTLCTDPFGGTGLRYNGIEIIGIAGSHGLTAAVTVLSNNTAASSWWTQGLALARIGATGISFNKLSGDGANPFTTAIFDLSTLVLNPQPFVLGNSANDTDLRFKNSANFAMGLSIDSGTSAGQISALNFSDRGTVKWIVRKNAANTSLEIVDSANTITFGVKRAADASGTSSIGSNTNHNLAIHTNDTERLRFDTAYNMMLGTTSIGTSAVNVIGIANGTAPSSSPTGMGQLYVETGALKYRGSGGTITTLGVA